MGRRLELQTLLEDLLFDVTGKRHVYFQKPPNNMMQYPCILYRRDKGRMIFADDKPYAGTKRYQVTVIDEDPDSDIPDRIEQLPRSLFDRFYTQDNLNHFVINLYY